MGAHILIVLTSHEQLGKTGRKTGFWLEEFAARALLGLLQPLKK